jgi:hypothetical protein
MMMVFRAAWRLLPALAELVAPVVRKQNETERGQRREADENAGQIEHGALRLLIAAMLQS